MIRYSHAMTRLMAYHNEKGTEAISIVLLYPSVCFAAQTSLLIYACMHNKGSANHTELEMGFYMSFNKLDLLPETIHPYFYRACVRIYKGQLSKKALEQVGLTPCQMFYFFFAAFTGFFAFAFLTILNMKIYFIAL